MTAPSPTTALPDADAGRRNMTLLIQLRWLAVGGQLATIAVVIGLMDIALPLAPLLARSEEHTSELQSLMRISYAVFCLKKKKNQKLTAHQAIRLRHEEHNPHPYAPCTHILN